jgi:hypothetical protein
VANLFRKPLFRGVILFVFFIISLASGGVIGFYISKAENALTSLFSNNDVMLYLISGDYKNALTHTNIESVRNFYVVCDNYWLLSITGFSNRVIVDRQMERNVKIRERLEALPFDMNDEGQASFLKKINSCALKFTDSTPPQSQPPDGRD